MSEAADRRLPARISRCIRPAGQVKISHAKPRIRTDYPCLNRPPTIAAAYPRDWTPAGQLSRTHLPDNLSTPIRPSLPQRKVPQHPMHYDRPSLLRLMCLLLTWCRVPSVTPPCRTDAGRQLHCASAGGSAGRHRILRNPHPAGAGREVLQMPLGRSQEAQRRPAARYGRADAGRRRIGAGRRAATSRTKAC